jgi:hypothetical protein
MPGSITRQTDTNGRTVDGIYQPGNTTLVLPQAGTVSSDPNNNQQQYAPQLVQLTGQDGFGNIPVSLGNIVLGGTVQKAGGVSTGSVATLAQAFTNSNKTGNSIVVVAGCGNGTAMTVADSAGNTYTSAVAAPNSTTFAAQIFYCAGIKPGPNTVTVTNAGTAASIAVEIYEVNGLIAQATAALGQIVTATGTGTTASTTTVGSALPNSFAFAGVAIGTGVVTAVAAGTGLTYDSGTLQPVTPAGLFQFASFSGFLNNIQTLTPSASWTTSEPWAMAAAVFRPVAQAVEGSFIPTASPQGGALAYHLVSLATTNATVVKAGPGTLYSATINCNTSAAARYVKFYNVTAAPTAGAGTIYYVIQCPLLAASTGSTTVVNFGPNGLAFSAGISFVTVTTLADSGSTGVGAGDLSIDLVYI